MASKNLIHKLFRVRGRLKPFCDPKDPGSWVHPKCGIKTNCRLCLSGQTEEQSERRSVHNLIDAINHVKKHHPLPRCPHGSALKDHAGDLLEPPCGCRWSEKEL